MIDKGYVPKVSYRNTIEFFNSFENAFKNYLIKSYHLINFELPILTNINSSVDINLEQKRYINFDNSVNNNIYQLIYNYNNLINYMIWNFQLKEKECAFFKYSYIERDCEITRSNTMQKNIFSINFVVQEEDRNIKFLTSMAIYIIEGINEAILNCEKYYKVRPFFINKNSYNILDIKKKYSLLNFKKSFDRFIALKKNALVYNVINEFTNSNITSYKDADSYDWENTMGWYLFDEITQTPLEIFLITITPNWSIYTKQKLIYNDSIENNDYIDKLKSDNFPSIVSIKINYDLLLYVLLKKININELPSLNNEYNLNMIYKFFK